MRKFAFALLFAFTWSGTTLADMISLPKTGQATCYDSSYSPVTCSGTGQDGEKLSGTTSPSPRLDNSDGTVTDNLTGLLWTKDANFIGSVSTQDAYDYVAGMNTSAHSNFGHACTWRMPNVLELQSLIDYGQSNPALPSGHPFTNVQSSLGYYYHTSTTFPLDLSEVMVINLYNGNQGISGSGTRPFWPVCGESADPAKVRKTGQTTSYTNYDDGYYGKGASWPTTRFLDNSDGTVNDLLTGLMWKQNAGVQVGTWQSALDYVAGMNAGTYSNFGYTDWRLPNINELETLRNWGSSSSVYLPSGHPFSGASYYYYWSSTTLASDGSYAWYITPSGDPKYFTLKSYGGYKYVWPVRTVGFRYAVWSFYQTSGTYGNGECVPYVRYETGITYAACHGDAADCLSQAQGQGYHTGTLPIVGAIAVFARDTWNGNIGHVGVVISKDDNTPSVTLEDQNGAGDHAIGTHTFNTSTHSVLGYIYYKPM